MGQMDMATMDDAALLMLPADNLPPGASQVAEMSFTEPAAEGELEFVCAVAGRLDAGMVLAITVTS